MSSLLARLVGQLAMWDASMHNRPYDVADEAGWSLAEIRTRLDEIGPVFLDQVRRFADEDRFEETFLDATCEPPRAFTYGGMVAHVLTFAAHRRVLVLGALSDAGITYLGGRPAGLGRPARLTHALALVRSGVSAAQGHERRERRNAGKRGRLSLIA